MNLIGLSSSIDTKTCHMCGSTENISCCPCKMFAYCSKDCQRKHWKEVHKDQCPAEQAAKKNKPYNKKDNIISGKHQHKTLNDVLYITLMGRSLRRPGGALDCHCWHEINGQVYDLALGQATVPDGVPDGDMQHEKFTKRRPFSDELQRGCMPYAIESWTQCKAALEAIGNEAHQMKQQICQTEGQCIWRAFILMEDYPEHFNMDTLRIGSLGYRDANGHVFWEYG